MIRRISAAWQYFSPAPGAYLLMYASNFRMVQKRSAALQLLTPTLARDHYSACDYNIVAIREMAVIY